MKEVLRIGEMEKDCMLVHGISKFLHEKMFDQSDKFIINLCVPCKSYFKVVKTQNGFFVLDVMVLTLSNLIVHLPQNCFFKNLLQWVKN